jgi:hypothetical protein
MARHALVMFVLLQVAGFPAGAAEFISNWDVEGVWNSNVLRDVTDEESSFSVRTGPTLGVRETQGDFVYDVSYQVFYEAFAQLDGLNSFDQFASASGAWTITPATTIAASDNFAYVSGFSDVFETTGNIATVTAGRTRIITNNANASLTHRFGALWELSSSVGNQLYDYRDPTQSDTTSTSGVLQLTRGITRRLVAGVGVQYQRQEFSAVPQNPANGTTFYQGFGVVNYSFSPTWRISVQAGPALAQPDSISVDSVSLLSYFAVDPRTCPTNAAGTPVLLQFPQSDADLCERSLFRTAQGTPVAALAPTTTRIDVPFVGDQEIGRSLNYFGRINIQKEWRTWRASLGYSRSASNSSGLSTSTALDQFRGDLTWTPSPLWNLAFQAVYSKQTSVSDVRQREVALLTESNTQILGGVPATAFFGVPFEVDTGATIANAVDVDTMYFELSGVRRISRRFSIDGAASYWQQDTSGVLNETRTQVIRVDIGFTWNFDAIPL